MEPKTGKRMVSKGKPMKTQGTHARIPLVALLMLLLVLCSSVSGAHSSGRKYHPSQNKSQSARLQAQAQLKIARLETENKLLRQQLAEAHGVERSLRKPLRAYKDWTVKQRNKVVELQAQLKTLQQTNDALTTENKRLASKGK